MEGEQNDFVVESKGHCFLCLERKSPSHKLASQLIRDLSSPLNSLQCLSRYIKLNMMKVFCSDDLESIPPHLLAKVQTSKLKVELCEKCVSINQRFSGLYRQLEKIEMEMATCLKVIVARLEDTPKIAMTPQTLALDKGKLEVVEALRKDVFEKSSVKIGGSSLRIKIKRLTRKEVTASSKPKRKPSPRKANMDMNEERYQPSNVKFEHANEDFIMNDDNDGFLDQSEDCINNSDEDEKYSSTKDIGKSENFSNFPSMKKKMDREDDRSIANSNTMSVTFPSSPSQRAWTTNPTTGKRKCKTCSKEFSQSSGFIAHYRSVHLQAKYKCTLCGKEFTSFNGHKFHHQAVHMGVRFKCLACAKCFFDRSTLRRHQRTCGSGNLPV